MEVLFILIGLGALLYLLIGPGIAWHLASEARREIEALRGTVDELKAQIERLRRMQEKPVAEIEPPKVMAASKVEPVVKPEPILATPSVEPPPPPLPVMAKKEEAVAIKAPELPQAEQARKPVLVAKPQISLEQFLGVKLFAWIGGLALFLGIVFFVKYAFERNLISPALRTAIGFLIGGGLVAAGVIMRQSKAYAVLAQTLAATGVLILYGVTFAAHALYHFPAFGTVSTFVYAAHHGRGVHAGGVDRGAGDCGAGHGGRFPDADLCELRGGQSFRSI